MFRPEEVCERQYKALVCKLSPLPPLHPGQCKPSKLTWMKEGNFALANLPTTALNSPGNTSPILPPAFRNRCMMSSPVNIPPDSENEGERKRARRWNRAVRPGVPSAACLGVSLRPSWRAINLKAEGGEMRRPRPREDIPLYELFTVFPDDQRQVYHPMLPHQLSSSSHESG